MEEIIELENYIEEKPEPKPWENAPDNVIYYAELYEDKHLAGITESAEMAYEYGFFDNQVSKDDVEQSEVNGWTYLKGYAPHKTESMILIEQYQSEIIELKKYLSDTDYKAIKFAEGEITESDYQDDKIKRHDARVRINELESMIEELENK